MESSTSIKFTASSKGTLTLVFGESGKPEELLKAYNLTAQDIVNKVKEAIILKNKF